MFIEYKDHIVNLNNISNIKIKGLCIEFHSNGCTIEFFYFNDEKKFKEYVEKIKELTNTK